MHAYLRTLGVPTNEHHDIMASDWREAISDQLRADYPNLSQTDADALAWGGLNESHLWQQMLANDIANNTGITGAIKQTNDNQKNLNNQNNGSNGTHCN
ncbi:hypothetical protein PBAC_31940 [Pedobacter glucosidilyticus]|nr:hypothetical protein PBAC_31940 [Pedobacter glucosidilyticus]